MSMNDISAEALSAARAGIDAADNAILAALGQRAQHVLAVKHAKGDGRIVYRPAREIQIMRRLHANLPPHLSMATAYHVWREMIGGALVSEGALSVSVYNPEGGTDIAAIARDTFGGQARYVLRPSANRVFQDVGGETPAIGLAPAPGGGGEAWWRAFLSAQADDGPHVVAALPMVGDAVRALVISRAPLEPSGDDVTLVSLRLPEPVSRAMISTRFRDLPGAPQAIDADGQDMLIALRGFHIDAEDEANRALRAAFDLSAGSWSLIGAYGAPVPLTVAAHAKDANE